MNSQGLPYILLGMKSDIPSENRKAGRYDCEPFANGISILLQPSSPSPLLPADFHLLFIGEVGCCSYDEVSTINGENVSNLASTSVGKLNNILIPKRMHLYDIGRADPSPTYD